MNIGKMWQAASAYYMTEHSDLAQNIIVRQFPDSVDNILAWRSLAAETTRAVTDQEPSEPHSVAQRGAGSNDPAPSSIKGPVRRLRASGRPAAGPEHAAG